MAEVKEKKNYRTRYSSPEKYKEIEVYIYSYVKTHYHKVLLKLTPAQRDMWYAACDERFGGEKNKLTAWIIESCRMYIGENTVYELKRNKKTEDYVYVTLRLKKGNKNADYEVFEKAARKHGIPLTTWIKMACDTRAGWSN